MGDEIRYTICHRQYTAGVDEMTRGDAAFTLMMTFIVICFLVAGVFLIL